MTKRELVEQIKQKRSFLCIGLDVDLEKIPQHLLQQEDPIFEFNKAIIDATHQLAIAYKPNTAFYEAYGLTGWKALQRTINYLNENYPEIFTIADAKRGDIGNTSGRYAKAFFEDLAFDSITVAPYMGKDSVEPFLAYDEKHTILLALTSNEGAYDFQTIQADEEELFKKVIKVSRDWENGQNLMYVVGATKAQLIAEVRQLAPNNFFLVPGVGAQGENLQEVCKYGLNSEVGLLINSSRNIIYASSNSDFAIAAARAAEELQLEMKQILTDQGY